MSGNGTEERDATPPSEKEKADQATLAQQQAEAIADQELQQKEKLANYLRAMGINPAEI